VDARALSPVRKRRPGRHLPAHHLSRRRTQVPRRAGRRSGDAVGHAAT
jgi:hypothetical protein